MRLKALNECYRPGLFSEHLAWSSHRGRYFSDLLPLPYTDATLARVCRHVDEAQEAMSRQMLIENPSSYLGFAESEMGEPEFIGALVQRTGCALLLDVNNVFVSAHNLGFSPVGYLDAYPLEHVREIHLGGHDEQADDSGAVLLIDAHGAEIADPVWTLFAEVIARTGPLPTLIERDAHVPALPELLAEARRADATLVRTTRRQAA